MIDYVGGECWPSYRIPFATSFATLQHITQCCSRFQHHVQSMAAQGTTSFPIIVVSNVCSTDPAFPSGQSRSLLGTCTSAAFFRLGATNSREEEKKLVFPPFRAERECSLEMDVIADDATPTEAQTIPWPVIINFHCRNPEGLRAWLASANY